MTQLNQIPISRTALAGEGISSNLDFVVSNMMTGNYEAAMRALTEGADELSPVERQRVAERFGIEKTPLKELTNVLTNPLVILGAIMTLRFPVPRAGRLASFAGELGQVKKRFPVLEWISNLEDNFQGTRIPAIIDGIRDRYTSFMVPIFNSADGKFLGAVDKYKRATGKDFTAEQLARITAHLDGLDDPKNPLWQRLAESDIFEGNAVAQRAISRGVRLRPLTGPEKTFAGDVRALFEESGQLLADADNSKLARFTLRKVMGFKGGEAAGDAIDLIQNYWPHIPIKRVHEHGQDLMGFADEFENALTVLRDTGSSKAAEAAKRAKPLKQVTRSALRRGDYMIPDPTALRVLGVDESFLSHLQSAIDKGRPVYSLSFDDGVEAYFDRLARTVAWAFEPTKGANPLGVQLLKETNRMLRAAKTPAEISIAQHKASQIRNTYIPLVLGGHTPGSLSRMESWNAMKGWAHQHLKSLSDKKMLPKGMAETMMEWVSTDPTKKNWFTSGKIASFFYQNTLGLPNPIPAIQNLGQTLSTLPGIVGVGATFKAHTRVASQMGDMFQDIAAGNRNFDLMLKRAFPDFYKANLEFDAIARDALEESIERSFVEGHSLLNATKGSRKKIGQYMLSAFRVTETYNRLVAFEAGMMRGARDLVGKKVYLPNRGIEVTLKKGSEELAEASRQFGKRVVEETQFGSGITNTPAALLGASPLVRQFTTFPLRMASLGGKMISDPEYAGALGRTMLVTGGITAGAREFLGRDPSRMLFLGGLPEPSEDLPFSPLPVVPPALQIAGAAYSAVGGDFSGLQKSLPLFVPGGVGISRMLPTMPGVGAASGKLLDKPYVDYDNPIVDDNGTTRYRSFNPDGSLRNYLSRGQIIGRAMGMKATSEMQEQVLMKYLLSQRNRIRTMKRDYMNALAAGDDREAMHIKEQFQRQYPSIPFPISDRDIKALHTRQNVARIERVLDTIPADMRDMFTGVTSVALGSQGINMLGLHNAGLLQGNTIRQRDSYRHARRGGVRGVAQGGAIYRQGEDNILGDADQTARGMAQQTFGRLGL